MNNTDSSSRNFEKARRELAVDMRSRGIGAIIWDNSTAGFHFIPEVTPADSQGNKDVVTVGGLYLFHDTVYVIDEKEGRFSIDNLYNPNYEIKPMVVTLDENDALRLLGNPVGNEAFTTEGTLKQWLTIADCYFEALNLAKEEED